MIAAASAAVAIRTVISVIYSSLLTLVAELDDVAADEDAAPESSATATALRSSAAIAALSQSMTYREVLDTGRDGIGRTSDEEHAELIVSADDDVRPRQAHA
jgi:hypothetical protein